MLKIFYQQLRPPQMLGDESHHQSQRPCFSSDIRRQGRRERQIHRREPGVRLVWVRPSHGGERRQSQPISTEGWTPEERMEREQSALGGV